MSPRTSNGANGVHAFQRTMRAILMCLKCRKFQPHVFHGLVPARVADDTSLTRPVSNVMYECTNCSTHRVWGCETQWQ